ICTRRPRHPLSPYTTLFRSYEQKGLLPPPERNGSGYRIYDEKDLARLHFIRRSQELGFSLQDIKQLLQLTGSILTPRREVKSFRSEEHTSELQSRENLVCRL